MKLVPLSSIQHLNGNVSAQHASKSSGLSVTDPEDLEDIGVRGIGGKLVPRAIEAQHEDFWRLRRAIAVGRHIRRFLCGVGLDTQTE